MVEQPDDVLKRRRVARRGEGRVRSEDDIPTQLGMESDRNATRGDSIPAGLSDLSSAYEYHATTRTKTGSQMGLCQ